MNNFHYVGVLLDMLYGIEVEDEFLEEIGLIAWGLIGNKNVKLYRYEATIDPRDNSVTLPCNAISGLGAEGGIVEAVTTNYEDWNRETNYSDRGDINSAAIEHSIESQKYYTNPLYISGKLLDYEQVKDKLYFAHNYGKVNILYKGILADDEGLPELTDKEATAIATYIAYVIKYKDGLATNNTLSINMAKSLEATWNRLCDLARVSYLNLNDVNNILLIKNSWDRPAYNFSYKPIR